MFFPQNNLNSKATIQFSGHNGVSWADGTLFHFFNNKAPQNFMCNTWYTAYRWSLLFSAGYLKKNLFIANALILRKWNSNGTFEWWAVTNVDIYLFGFGGDAHCFITSRWFRMIRTNFRTNYRIRTVLYLHKRSTTVIIILNHMNTYELHAEEANYANISWGRRTNMGKSFIIWVAFFRKRSMI